MQTCNSACGPTGTGCSCAKDKCNCQNCGNHASESTQQNTVRFFFDANSQARICMLITRLSDSVAATTPRVRSARARRPETNVHAASERQVERYTSAEES